MVQCPLPLNTLLLLTTRPRCQFDSFLFQATPPIPKMMYFYKKNVCCFSIKNMYVGYVFLFVFMLYRMNCKKKHKLLQLSFILRLCPAKSAMQGLQKPCEDILYRTHTQAYRGGGHECAMAIPSDPKNEQL